MLHTAGARYDWRFYKIEIASRPSCRWQTGKAHQQVRIVLLSSAPLPTCMNVYFTLISKDSSFSLLSGSISVATLRPDSKLLAAPFEDTHSNEFSSGTSA